MLTLPQYLKRQKMTQAQFAALIGATQGEISKLCNENVSRRPSWEMAARIEEATNGEVPLSVWTQPKAAEGAA